MSNASTKDARRGWELYTGSMPRPSLDEINERLVAESRRPIKERTYDHYTRLERHGLTTYMPVNQLDVAVRLGLFADGADRGTAA